MNDIHAAEQAHAIDAVPTATARPYPGVHNAILLCLLLMGLQLAAGLVAGVIAGAVWGVRHAGAISAALQELGAALPEAAEAELTRMTAVVALIASPLMGGLPVLIGCGRLRRREKRGGLEPRPWGEVFRLRALSRGQWLALLAIIPALIIVTSEIDNVVRFFLPMTAFWEDTLRTLSIEGHLALSLFLVALCAPLSEELLFRGLLLDGLSRCRSGRTAILVTALLFAVVHLNPWQGVSAFVLGAAAAWLALRSGSLLPGICLHVINNAVWTLADEFGDRLPLPGFAFMSDSVSFQPWWFDAAGLVLLAAGLWLFSRARGQPQPASVFRAAFPAPAQSPLL